MGKKKKKDYLATLVFIVSIVKDVVLILIEFWEHVSR